MSTRAREQARIQRKLEEIRRKERSRQRRLRLIAAISAATIVVAAAVGIAVWASAGGHPAAHRGELAGLGSMAKGSPVDGIACSTSEQSAYHIRAHLAVFVNGTRQAIPADIGIPAATPGSSAGCLYWLHTHDTSGVVHIESPNVATYTLGDFFDIWGQPLSGTAAGPATGHLTAYVNGKIFTGNPRAIPLRPHAIIQLDIGTRTPPLPYHFAPGL